MPEDDSAVAAALDAIPVRLSFELGRIEVAVDELRAMGPGHVLALPRDPAGGAVDILANGRRVGAGEIVTVGDALGVRVLRLFGRD
jgi:type III secretion protein Q